MGESNRNGGEVSRGGGGAVAERAESSYGEVAEATFLPLDVYLDEEKREKKQFMVSLRHGKLIDKKKLLDVLSGKN